MPGLVSGMVTLRNVHKDFRGGSLEGMTEFEFNGKRRFIAYGNAVRLYEADAKGVLVEVPGGPNNFAKTIGSFSKPNMHQIYAYPYQGKYHFLRITYDTEDDYPRFFFMPSYEEFEMDADGNFSSASDAPLPPRPPRSCCRRCRRY